MKISRAAYAEMFGPTVGDRVRVTGTVTEYLSDSAPATMSQTELAAVTVFTKVDFGRPIPAPVPVTLPFASARMRPRSLF